MLERGAEADVDQPRLVEVDTQAEVVEAHARHVSVVDARFEPRDDESERREQLGEGAVELRSETAAAGEDLGHERLRLEDDRHAQVDVEILERDREQMGALQTAQTGGRD